MEYDDHSSPGRFTSCTARPFRRCIRTVALVVPVHFLLTAFIFVLDFGASLHSGLRGDMSYEAQARVLESILRILVPIPGNQSSLGGALLRVLLSGLIYGAVIGLLVLLRSRVNAPNTSTEPTTDTEGSPRHPGAL